ncbi:uncharacterized protein LOC111324601 [Stylophora pistillata]|uniref:uncharacterized protein LOC111324601 n=1 Tax=Stylophora pistillata TaxID=50429 RepID=UPI000C03D85E|nr:uncharacterized protein LOC111324601 [Stylophora pistillata]
MNKKMLAFLFLIHLMAHSTRGQVTECSFGEGFDNDSVFCRGYTHSGSSCTNEKECCTNPKMNNGCFNMSVIQAHNLWKPPRVCSAKDFAFKQNGNSTNKAIDGHIIGRHKVVSRTQCGDFCIREPQCSAFNLATSTDHEGKMECQLIENDESIVNRDGFSFCLFVRESYKETYLTPLCES